MTWLAFPLGACCAAWVAPRSAPPHGPSKWCHCDSDCFGFGAVRGAERQQGEDKGTRGGAPDRAWWVCVVARAAEGREVAQAEDRQPNDNTDRVVEVH